MADFNVNAEIQKELNSLAPEEKDINKIAKATHRSLLIMSVRDAIMEIRKEEEEKRKKGEGEGKKTDEKEIKIFHEKIRKSYLEKLDFFKKQLFN